VHLGHIGPDEKKKKKKKKKFSSMLRLTDFSNEPRTFRLLDPEDGSTMNIRNVANFTS
jgi:hypothetical protein